MKPALWRAALTVALVSSGSTAYAAPSYNDADAVLDAMTKVVDESYLWAKRTPQQRVQTMRDVNAVVARAQKVFGGDVFGPFGQCLRAATYLQLYAESLSDFSRALDGHTQLNDVQLLRTPQNAFAFGDAYRVCRNLVEPLDSSARKRQP